MLAKYLFDIANSPREVSGVHETGATSIHVRPGEGEGEGAGEALDTCLRLAGLFTVAYSRAVPAVPYELVVVGGGPGGSTAAALVAKRGHSVLVLERAQFPRYQVGESLLPATVHGICPLLGVSSELERAGFVKKRGGTFRWGISPEPWTFSFAGPKARAGDEPPWQLAYQVERAKFDEILLRNVIKCGGDVQESAVAEDLLFAGDRVSGVRWRDASGRTHETSARYVIDASGHRGMFHHHVGERVYSDLFKNIALFGYYANGKRLPPPNDGNILCCAFEDGWFWYIPLSPTLTSVGVVTGREHAERMRDPEEAMGMFIAKCPLIKEHLAGATRITDGMYGEFRIRKDYSYCNTRLWRPGLALVGDSGAFIDPVFSSGVHLATYAGLLTARAINTCLMKHSDILEQDAFNEFEARFRLEFQLFYDFLLGFYDMKQSEQGYFWHARSVLHTEEASNEAFIRIVSGGASCADEYFRLRQGLGDAVQWMATPERAQGRPDDRLIAMLSEPHEVPRALVIAGQIGVTTPEHDVATRRGRSALAISEDGLAWRRA